MIALVSLLLLALAEGGLLAGGRGLAAVRWSREGEASRGRGEVSDEEEVDLLVGTASASYSDEEEEDVSEDLSAAAVSKNRVSRGCGSQKPGGSGSSWCFSFSPGKKSSQCNENPLLWKDVLL